MWGGRRHPVHDTCGLSRGWPGGRGRPCAATCRRLRAGSLPSASQEDHNGSQDQEQDQGPTRRGSRNDPDAAARVVWVHCWDTARCRARRAAARRRRDAHTVHGAGQHRVTLLEGPCQHTVTAKGDGPRGQLTGRRAHGALQLPIGAGGLDGGSAKVTRLHSLHNAVTTRGAHTGSAQLGLGVGMGQVTGQQAQ